MSKSTFKPIMAGVLAITALIALFMCAYTTEEGHVTIVKRFSEAKEQVGPGLHFKWPFMDTVEHIEVRTRRSQEDMASSTSEQMPVKVSISVNWTLDKSAALDMYRKYGGVTQFEDRILAPKFRSVTKNVIPHYSAESLIQDREKALVEIFAGLEEVLANYPLKVDGVQIENIDLPTKYLASIETKQTEKNLSDAEKFKLDRQALEAQQSVNTERAKADGIKLVAIAESESIRLRGLAEAEAIKAKGLALRDNPLIVELEQAKSWDGKLPSTVMGSSGSMPILDMRNTSK
jgi:regulator of protease activity HflC (stomatin/prohibitin superfamily)